jgi:mRNA interferase MazF
MKRGEIRWYRFKAPDKKRPVLILSRTSAIPYLNEITIAPLTRTIREIPTEVVLGPEDGVSVTSAVNLDHLQTVQKANIGAVIASLTSRRMEQVKNALLFALGFDR